MIITIDNDNKPIFISFSGGETSGDMLLRVWEKYNGKRKIVVLFANTGQEDNRTLEFVHLVETYYEIPIVWLEAIVNPIYGKGIKHKVVNYYTASRHDDGSITPMEQIIDKLGIPNGENAYCTRDLKTRVMEHWLKENGWIDFYTLVGIRRDEGFDRLTSQVLFYEPYWMGITKPQVNESWEKRPFRLANSQRSECRGLGLLGREGNCRWCYKKTLRKHLSIMKETPNVYDFPEKMESKYENYVHPKRLEKLKKKGKTVHFPIRFFRENKSVQDIREMAKEFNDIVIDDTQQTNYQVSLFNGIELDKPNGDCFDSCEPFK